MITGGGTTAMEMAVANLVEPGDRVVVANTGFFSDRLARMLCRQGAHVAELRVPVGDVPQELDVRAALDAGPVKLVAHFLDRDVWEASL